MVTTQKKTIKKNLLRLWSHLPARRKKQLPILGFLMIAASLAEVINISALLAFLGAVAYPQRILSNEFVQPIVSLLRIASPEDLLLHVTLVFIGVTILAGIVRITLLGFQIRLSWGIGADFGAQVYERTLYQPYSLHVSRNSSAIIAGVRKAAGLVGTFIQPTMLLISSLALVLAVITALLVIQPVVALSTLLGFGFIYCGVIFVTRYRIARNSETIAIQDVRVTKALQEGLGGIRDVLIDSSQPVYSKLFKDSFVPLQLANANNQLVGAAPRFGVETFGIVFIASLAYILGSAGGATSDAINAIPVLGALALAAQRLLPALQQSYSSYITIKGSQASIEVALDLLDQPMPEWAKTRSLEPLTFETSITLKDIGFRYAPREPWVLRHLNLKISKGSRIGFIGVTGGGKSTLLDILMGLLTPTEGMLTIDNTAVTLQNTRAWQAHISHVPQAIFLADTSIAENIALGTPYHLIDLQRVKQAAEQAQIARVVEGWRNGYDTLVGERGIRLSGGQRQRIGIARALYKQTDIIIFDEATSALDSETETAVMQAVETIDRKVTILIVAHRLSTLKNCDRIVVLADQNIKTVTGYSELARI